MCLWADSEALKQYMIQPYIFAFERLSSSLSSCCARANSVNHRVRRVRRVAQLFWFNSNTYRRLKFTGQNSETNELVNIGVVALDMNKYTFTEGLACNGFMKACSEGIGAAIGVCIQNVNMQPKHKHFCPWQDTALLNILQKKRSNHERPEKNLELWPFFCSKSTMFMRIHETKFDSTLF